MKTTNLINVTLTNEPAVFTPELIALEQRLQELKAGEQFKLCLIGPGQLLMDTALAMYEIIMARPSGVQLHIHSHSWLEDAEVLVWLAGDTRTLRPGAWIHFQDHSTRFAEKKHLHELLEFPLEDNENKTEWTPVQVNYAQVERLVNKRLPQHLMNRRVWAGELAEWNLINSATTDEQ